MTSILSLVAALLVGPSGWWQAAAPSVADIIDEPHHRLLLKNETVRVFRLDLPPKEATLPHSHKFPFVFISLHPGEISNEVRDRKPILTELEAGDLHTSQGGFTVAERNNSAEQAELIAIESVKPDDGSSFGKPLGGFHLHSAAVGELFESSGSRGYKIGIAAGGRIEKRPEDYDRLLVALSDLNLHDDVEGQPPAELQMKAGEVRWFPRGLVHSTSNVGGSPAAFITLEFK